MESSEEEVKRSTQVITIQPNETVLTAFPYGPHTSLLDVLKGEPRVLGVSLLPPVVRPGRENLSYFSKYVCRDAFQEGS